MHASWQMRSSSSVVTPTFTASAELEQDLAAGVPGGAHAVGELVGRDRGHERRRVGRVRRAGDRGRDLAVGRQAARRAPAIVVPGAARRTDATRRRARFSFSWRLFIPTSLPRPGRRRPPGSVLESAWLIIAVDAVVK